MDHEYEIEYKVSFDFKPVMFPELWLFMFVLGIEAILWEGMGT